MKDFPFKKHNETRAVHTGTYCIHSTAICWNSQEIRSQCASSWEFIVGSRPANTSEVLLFFLKWGQEALSLSDHRNWVIQAGLSNVARHRNLMHSRAHKHVDQTGLINPDYTSTQLLNIHAVFHLFPFTKPPAHRANMVLIKLTSFSTPHFLKTCFIIFQ